ncbi:MAG: hypothetical protein RIK87_11600 [Fuerstiella sp.]
MEHSQPFFVTIESPTWLLYVSLLLVAVFFRFSRWLSVRNLDLTLLLTLSTALVISATETKHADLEAAGFGDASAKVAPAGEAAAEEGAEAVEERRGAHWSTIAVMALSILVILRLTFDESLTRRPRLEQNLNQAGLTFLFLPAFSILMTGVFLKDPPPRNMDAVEAGRALLQRQESISSDAHADQTPPPATETLLAAAAAKVSELSGQAEQVRPSADRQTSPTEQFIARVLVVIAHAAVVVGLLYIGRRHFCSMQLGVSMSCLYLLLPCTAYNVHELSHVVPAACLTWAFANYRKPAIAGVLLGLACGTLFFAAFLLPLWAVFYGKKGSVRFGLSLGAVAAVVLITFALTSENTDSFVNKLVMTANWTAYRLFDAAEPMPSGHIGQVFLRITLAAFFFVMLVAMTVIPRKRNLENLLANSTALIVAAQLWYPEDVGTYVLWYLPLLLLVVFRPRLDRFVPPESPASQRSARQPDEKSQPAGSLSRVTLYS